MLVSRRISRPLTLACATAALAVAPVIAAGGAGLAGRDHQRLSRLA